LKRVNQRKPLGIFVENQGPRLFYGDATHLVAWHVKDLQVERDSSGIIQIKWTAPSGSRFDNKSKAFVPAGVPTKRQYEWIERRD
jgi:hypothetical protein